jgi:predicted hydrocarbon binding protein
MKFSCALSTSSDSVRLVNVVSNIVKEGYQLISQRQVRSESGGNIIYIVANSGATGTEEGIIAVLNKINGCKLLKIKFAEVRKRNSGSSIRFSGADEKSVLEALGQHYPNIAPIVKAYALVLADQDSSKKLRKLGSKVGAGIYQRDFALGSPLPISKSLKRELRPAMKEFCNVEIDTSSITISDCPFCADKDIETACCEFVSGYVSGFLNSNPAINGCEVVETKCGANSDKRCTFAISV